MQKKPVKLKLCLFEKIKQTDVYLAKLTLTKTDDKNDQSEVWKQKSHGRFWGIKWLEDSTNEKLFITFCWQIKWSIS